MARDLRLAETMSKLRYEWRAGYRRSVDFDGQLREVYGNDFTGFAGLHHARYLPGDVPFHVISRVVQGRWLLTPGAALNRIIAGVIGKAQAVYPTVRLYGMVFMSNHAHFLAQGEPVQLSAFVGYIKRELSCRWGNRPDVDWPGPMWNGLLATALPTAESQERCLRYILSHGVKEGIVAKPQHWPGIHCAKQLLTGNVLAGEWFDGTGYGKACDVERRKKRPKCVRKADYYQRFVVRLSTLPAWRGLGDAERRVRVRAMLSEIEENGRESRGGKRPLGAKAAERAPRETRSDLPPQPWFEKRRRLICWADPRHPETRAFVRRYWSFQQAYREAATAAKNGCACAAFPPLSFIPPRYRGPPQTAEPVVAAA